MRKCNVCGRRFRLLAKNRYEVVKSPVGLNCLTQGKVYYNAFDCSHCGCQNIVGVLEKGIVRDVELEEIQNKYKNNDEISYTPEEVGKILITEGQVHGRKYGLKLADTIKFTPTEVEKILKVESEGRRMTSKECKHCEHFDLFANICLIDNEKCYENKKCLREECKNYEDGKWGVNNDR